ncbi:pq loop repeat-containing protein [Stemphylium lycopersici]|uniref:PQ-loop-domain-containing protein n=1 Tax=Stemphylium lycopersici TaxID=183478 RepID=A0A364MY84_STELY|nr:pq loop repeat-containing protein [Stemphylium lycopersici]RAR07134.1 PQ-loop-domain-containing protein [Stemphylium lycopersici]
MDRPQVSIPPAANVLGIIPQIWTNWRRKSTEGLPGSMLILWSICGVPFGVYAIVQNFNFALKFQPQAFASLTLIAWGQTLYYHNKWRVWTATVATIALAASFGIMELILILTLRGPYSRGVEWPMMLMAILASVIQVVGLIPPFFELAKRNGRVIGIDFWFLTIDYLGAFFSLMAIVAQQWFDALGASLYIACMALETGIFASQAIWLWRVRHIRHEAKKAGKTYDEYVSENPAKKLPRSDSAETFVDTEAGYEKRSPSTCSEKTATSEQENTTVMAADATLKVAQPAAEALQAPPAAMLKPSGTGASRPSSPSPSA